MSGAMLAARGLCLPSSRCTAATQRQPALARVHAARTPIGRGLASRLRCHAAAEEAEEEELLDLDLQSELEGGSDAPALRPAAEKALNNLDFTDPSWADAVDGVNLTWEEFWQNSEAILFAEPDEEELIARGEDAIHLTPLQRMQVVLAQLPELRKRPGFMEYVSLGGGDTPVDLGEPEDALEDPDWNEWDFRALREKRLLAEAREAEFKMRVESLGLHEPLNMQETDYRVLANMRVPEEETREWSHDEIWNFITNNDRHADPRNVGPETFRVEDPLAPIDFNLRGVDYVEETEEMLDRMGHWLPAEERASLVDSELTLLDKDFELDDALDSPIMPEGADGAAQPTS